MILNRKCDSHSAEERTVGRRLIFPLAPGPIHDITPFAMIRKATIRDVKAIHALLQRYGAKGELLPRPLSQLYDHLRDFRVCEDRSTGQVIGCCALQFCWEDLAEIRSLAVHPEFRGRKIGAALVAEALAEAESFRIKKVFTLTYRPGFFQKLGFRYIDRSELPLKIWNDCMACVKFPNCDENALIIDLASSPGDQDIRRKTDQV